MHIQLTSPLRKGAILLLWNSSEAISQSEPIAQKCFRKHSVHLICLEVAIGESGTTDGA